MTTFRKNLGALCVFIISFTLLSFIQVKLKPPMIILERFLENGGWIEICILSFFGAFLYSKMQDKTKTSKWRTISWTIFSAVFFAQLILGLFGFEKFLMTGKLHLPIPGMIVGGAIYRLKITFMPILFLSTIILTGPAWCSQLCYFGALDNIVSKISNKKHTKLSYLFHIKAPILILFILGVIILRIFDTSIQTAVLFGGIFGILGLIIIIVLSSINAKMIHCIYYCPIGTLVNFLRYVNPFRMYIDNHCTDCQKCTRYCKYAALEKENITNRKPGITCTYCGDCLQSCHTNSIRYKLFRLSPEKARKAYLIITISIFIVFMGVARI